MNRRSFLACGCAAALGGGGLAEASSAPPIDIHHHMLPPFYKPAALEWLGRAGGLFPAISEWTPEASLAALDQAGGARAVLSVSAPATTQLPREFAMDMARRCNDYASDLAVRHPGRLAFFATLPMPHVAESLAEAERALALPGAAGIALLTSYDGRYLADEGFEPLFTLLNGRGATVFVHPTSAPCCAGLTPQVATPLIEFPVDTARTIAELLWSGALTRLQGIKFIFSHGAGVLPMLTERLQLVGRTDPRAAARVPEGVEAALRRLYVDTASVSHRAAMAAMREQFDHDRILFGSDLPWGSVAASLESLGRLGLRPSQLQNIAVNNAARLLRGVL